MFGLARVLGAAILVVAAAACSPDPAAFLAKSTGTEATKRKPVQPARLAAEGAVTSKASAKTAAGANPLLRIFGSQGQRGTEPAQARASRIARTSAPTKPTKKAVFAAKAVGALGARKSVKVVERTGRRTSTRADARVITSARPQASPVRRPAETVKQAEPVPARTPSTKPTDLIFYDVVSGIKTLHRSDGRIEEEAFDPATLPAIKAVPPVGRTRIKIVNETNPVSTGSTSDLQPHQPPATIKAGPR